MKSGRPVARYDMKCPDCDAACVTLDTGGGAITWCEDGHVIVLLSSNKEFIEAKKVFTFPEK